MRIALVCQFLAELGSVDLVLLPPPSTVANLDSRYPAKTAKGSMPANNRKRNEELFNAVYTMEEPISTRSYKNDDYSSWDSMESELANIRTGIEEKLIRCLAGKEYDLVWFNRERTWLIAGSYISAPSIIDVDDFEDILAKRWLALGKDELGNPLNELTRARTTADIEWWGRVHRDAAKAARLLVFSSEIDRELLGVSNSAVIPNVYQSTVGDPFQSVQHARAEPVILFQGWMQWPPNEDAALWLVDEITPQIREFIPNLQVLLAGSATPRIGALAEPGRVEVAGEVSSMTDYLRRAQIAVVPLRVGGGTRIKILEAFAHGVPVISTAIGAEGLEAIAGEHFELADSAQDIAKACVRLLKIREERYRLATAAYALYQRSYQPQHAREHVHRAVRKAMNIP